MKAVGERSDAGESHGSGRAHPRERTPDQASNQPVQRRTLTRRGVLRLQRSAGNAAVARMVAARSRGAAGSRGGGNGRATSTGDRGTPRDTTSSAGGIPSATSVDGSAVATGDLGHGLVVQRLAEAGECAAPPEPPKALAPQDDPRFQKVEKGVEGAGKALKAHPPAAGEAKKASDAAVAPPGDKEAQAKAAQADKMSGAKPGGFDKAAFVAAVRKAVAAKAPKNLEEADGFAESGKPDEIKAEVKGKVSQGKEASAKDIATKTGEPPDPSKAKDKPVTPLKDEPAPKPAVPDAAGAMPAKAPPEQTDLRAGKCETDSQMADAEVTEDQLAKSNEPEFTDALAAKKQGEEHSATAPGEVRQAEAQTLQGAEQGAAQSGQAAVTAMVQGRAGVQSQVTGNKGEAKSKDEAERQRITSEIKKIFDATKADVDKILNDLDGSVDSKFTAGEAAAKAAFEADHTTRMDRYKEQRYSGFTGKLRWAKDKLTRMPPEADALFLESKKVYESKMDVVISQIADHIGAELTRAKDRIAKGREQIAKFVAEQPKSLQKVAKDAAGEIGSQFDQLESDVDSKQESLVDDLATKYVEARQAVDDRIKELQEANKGLWEKAKDAVGGVIKTILQLKNMLMGVLTRAAGAIGKIIKDPIGFLGKLINAVKGGVQRFAGNIVEHLKKGLQGWLFGALASAGIEIPDSFDLKGIIKLVLSILGLTWTAIRTKIVKRIGETAMNAVEKGVDIFKTLVTEGVGGLWRFLVDKLSDLKDTVMSAIQDFVVVKIVKAGITWLISALNPAAAFIKACKMIYDVVMFFVEKGSQIKEFVDSVLDSIEEIAGGAVGKVAGLIENTLAKILPLLIGFLASLLGLGGISDKIKEILQKVQKPVGQAVDFVINGALKLARPIINLAKRGAAWAKGKYEAGKAKVKGAYERGKAKVRGAYEKGKEKVQGAADWIRGVVRGARSQKDFNMGDEGHTLYAEPTRDGQGLQIQMASKVKAPLPKTVDKIDEAIKRLGAGATGGRVPSDAIQRMRGAIRGAKRKGQQLEDSWQAFVAARKQERQPDPAAARTLKQQVDDGLADIAAGLIPVGPLTERQSDLAEKIKNLPEEGYRDKLYNAATEGSRWRSVRVKIIRRDLPDHLRRVFQILEPWRTFKNRAHSTGVMTEAQHAELEQRRQVVRKRLEKLALGRKSYLDREFLEAFDANDDISNEHLRRSDLWDVNHRVPLAAHWNSIGYNTGDAVRFAAAIDETNLELVSRSYNRGAGGLYGGSRHNFSKPPGPNFDTNADLG